MVVEDELAAAMAEIERLQALVEGRFKDAAKGYLRSAGPDGRGGFRFDIQSSIVPLIAEHLAASFKAIGGTNYVQMELTHDELGPLVMTIQRKHGELPAAKSSRLEAALKPFAEAVHNDNGDVTYNLAVVKSEHLWDAYCALREQP